MNNGLATNGFLQEENDASYGNSMSESDFIAASMERRFFGRRVTKTLSPRKKELWQGLIDKKIVYTLEDLPENCNPATLFGDFKPKKIILEIGFGAGEHIAHRAKQNPEYGYIGIDGFLTGAIQLAEKIIDEDIKNIRLFNEDALILIKNFLDASFDGLYLLYPDPWHKKRHHKRRFVQEDSINEFLRLLASDAKWFFASDVPAYIDWVLAEIHKQGGFIMDIHHHYQTPFEGWISTKYEQKALREGRNPHYFTFLKKKN